MECIDSNNREAYKNVKHFLHKLKLNDIVYKNYLKERLTNPLGYVVIGDFSIDQYNTMLTSFCKSCQQHQSLHSDTCDCEFHNQTQLLDKICRTISNEIIPQTICVHVTINNTITIEEIDSVSIATVRRDIVLIQRTPGRNPSKFIIKDIILLNDNPEQNEREIELELEVVNYWINSENDLEIESHDPKQENRVITSGSSGDINVKINYSKLAIGISEISTSINYFSEPFRDSRINCSKSLYTILFSLNNLLEPIMKDCERKRKYHQQKYEMRVLEPLGYINYVPGLGQIVQILWSLGWGAGWLGQRFYYKRNHKEMEKIYRVFIDNTLISLRSEIGTVQGNCPKIIEHIYRIEWKLSCIHQILLRARHTLQEQGAQQEQLRVLLEVCSQDFRTNCTMINTSLGLLKTLIPNSNENC